MTKCALLVAAVAVMVLVGCAEESVPAPTASEQSSVDGNLPDQQWSDGAPETGGATTERPVEGSPAPTVAPQADGAPLAVGSAVLQAPDGWRVSGVSSDDRSEVVSATSDDGQHISLHRAVTDATVEDEIATALAADAEQAAPARDIQVDGAVLRGVETQLTTSGGDVVQLRYFVRTGEALVTIDVVTTTYQRDALLQHLAEGLSLP